MDTIALISTIAIAILAGVCLYLGLPKYRATAMAICQMAFRIFAGLLIVILLMRFVKLFAPNTVTIQAIVNSIAFIMTVAAVTLVVVKHERTIKR